MKRRECREGQGESLGAVAKSLEAMMKDRQYCYRVIFAAASVLVLATAVPVSAVASEDAANASAQTAGERAQSIRAGILPGLARAHRRVQGAAQKAVI
ncbi:hypothetical protein BN2475_380152 [Paraburkholderia ribeironis]|uniref:Uncharacterized protein n=1 Tax=Paraburkholderia ribeironis TaxID=1247936 RepID=A0A1N7S6A6_9BURK|nr:hypothetical protein [Paraburkholderia ribeironis]SIT42902.1 hypothetical protein BN2475_380152 [Paraburkholderia ribeironis]